jgi:hypothetical protein
MKGVGAPLEERPPKHGALGLSSCFPAHRHLEQVKTQLPLLRAEIGNTELRHRQCRSPVGKLAVLAYKS